MAQLEGPRLIGGASLDRRGLASTLAHVLAPLLPSERHLLNLPTRRPHASGYAIFVSEETAKRVEAGETTGKKMTKLIKASWAATDAAAQEQFVSRFMTQKENFDAKWDAYEDALEAWEIEQEKEKENAEKDDEPVAVP